MNNYEWFLNWFLIQKSKQQQLQVFTALKVCTPEIKGIKSIDQRFRAQQHTGIIMRYLVDSDFLNIYDVIKVAIIVLNFNSG